MCHVKATVALRRLSQKSTHSSKRVEHPKQTSIDDQDEDSTRALAIGYLLCRACQLRHWRRCKIWPSRLFCLRISMMSNPASAVVHHSRWHLDLTNQANGVRRNAKKAKAPKPSNPSKRSKSEKSGECILFVTPCSEANVESQCAACCPDFYECFNNKCGCDD